MQHRRTFGLVAILVAVGILAAPNSSVSSEIRRTFDGPVETMDLYVASKPSCTRHTSHVRYATKPLSAAVTSVKMRPAEVKYDEDAFWEARYWIYQGLISQGSAPLFNNDQGYLENSDGTPVCLLHGRNDVVNNAELIRAIGDDYPELHPTLIAAAIAEQASDVDRAFGVDIWERTALELPGREDMSIGIAQLRPTEVLSLGLGVVDLFDPEIAVRGMYAKLRVAETRIEALEPPEMPLTLTERYMLLSLAQNHLGTVDDYFAVDGDWDQLMAMGNYARIMRYFLVHLDWLMENGWELQPDVDLERWRRIVFSAPRDTEPPEVGRRF